MVEITEVPPLSVVSPGKAMDGLLLNDELGSGRDGMVVEPGPEVTNTGVSEEPCVCSAGYVPFS